MFTLSDHFKNLTKLVDELRSENRATVLKLVTIKKNKKKLVDFKIIYYKLSCQQLVMQLKITHLARVYPRKSIGYLKTFLAQA